MEKQERKSQEKIKVQEREGKVVRWETCRMENVSVAEKKGRNKEVYQKREQFKYNLPCATVISLS